MAARIDLVDPSPEGSSLASGLRAAGFDVALRGVGEVIGTVADALVLAGDADGALEALRALRDDGASPDTPVVLLGTPPGTGHRGEGGPGFGAQAVLLRPVALGALVDALASVLAHDDVPRSRTTARREPTLDIGSAGPEQTGMRATPSSGARREMTMQLPDTGTDPLREVDALPPPDVSVVPASVIQKTPATGPGDPMSPSSSGAVRGPTAAISEHLRALLEAADRRAFPSRAPIDLSLPGGDEPAAELVPAELLDQEEIVVDPLGPEEDPIDAFTFVGGPVLPGAASFPEPAAPGSVAADRAEPREDDAHNRRKTAPGTPTSLSRRPPPPPDGEPRDTLPPLRPPTEIESGPAGESWDSPSPGGPGNTGVHEARVRPGSVAPPPPAAPAGEWPDEDSVLGRASPEGNRRGSLAEGGALRLLLRVAELRLDARLTISAAGLETITIVIASGELASLEGGAATRAVDALRRRGAAVSSAADESGATRALDEAVERASITLLERDRALREGRERLVAELVSQARATFTLARLDPHELPPRGPSPLGAPLRHAILEAARRGIGIAHARQIVGADVVLRRAARFEAIAAEGLVAPEIAALLARCEGATLEHVLGEAADEPGAPGLIAALVASGALSAHAAPAASEPLPAERARVARRLLEEAARVAEDADYFAILGVATEASDRDLEHAHRVRRAQLAALELGELGLPASEAARLEALRAATLDALDEARAVLREPRWREAYAAAIAHAPSLAGPGTEH